MVYANEYLPCKYDMCTSLKHFHVHNVCVMFSVWMSGCNIASSVGMCSELSSPVNGEVTWTGLTTGSTATYTCDSDYQLTGDQTRTCLNTGVWSGQEPTCTCMRNALACSLPHIIHT